MNNWNNYIQFVIFHKSSAIFHGETYKSKFIRFLFLVLYFDAVLIDRMNMHEFEL